MRCRRMDTQVRYSHFKFVAITSRSAAVCVTENLSPGMAIKMFQRPAGYPVRGSTRNDPVRSNGIWSRQPLPV